MEIVFHGATKEVGRSCVEVITAGKNRFLLDAGIKFSDAGTEFPSPVIEPSGLKGVFISHAHLDHTGYIPLLDANGLRCPIFATEPTKATTKMLLMDAFKIGRIRHEHLGYGEENIAKALSWMRRVKLDRKGSIGDIEFEMFDAGHIPGSASVLIEANEKKRLFYTGDINTTDTRLLKKAEAEYKDLGEIDMMITEATYGGREHPKREKEEKEFIESIKSTIDNGGSVIVPVFAEGRSQEIMLILDKIGLEVPVYLDGMAIEATRMIREFPSSVKDPKALESAFKGVKLVKGVIQREKIAHQQGVFVTTSGMLTGGPVMTYLREMSQNKKNAILLTGYQAEHTNGRLLVENGIVFIDGWRTKINCYVRKFDFSAHCGRSELRALIRKINPGSIAVNHGDADSCLALAEWADAMGFKAHVPYMNERINV
ncbi:MAG TPA: MBL fold metallo-hydrolase [Candidatus Nanoarchaeia archaeon]|nr:MBL fold metallo-hydrolase [Candidatus Nanoarchaeia archaeon]